MPGRHRPRSNVTAEFREKKTDVRGQMTEFGLPWCDIFGLDYIHLEGIIIAALLAPFYYSIESRTARYLYQLNCQKHIYLLIRC